MATAVAQEPTGRRLASFVPIIGWLPTYNGRLLRSDLMAGVTVGAFAVPESMAYAGLAGLAWITAGSRRRYVLSSGRWHGPPVTNGHRPTIPAPRGDCWHRRRAAPSSISRGPVDRRGDR
jgi:hypothetical protein